jgi:glucosyl-dolichyl phosphate glucuronosyltransferase
MEISIIICTYNRAKSLKKTLHSIRMMSLPEDLSWEIIIVDNNSKDNTKAMVEDFEINSGLNIRYVFEEKQGLSHARNRGIYEAKGNIVAFLDDDVIVTHNWLIALIRAFSANNPSVVGGRVLLHDDFTKPLWLGAEVSSPLGAFDIGENIVVADSGYRGLIGIGANMAFKKEVFIKYGLFRTDLGRKGNKLSMGEETEFFWRLRDNNEICIYYPFAVVYHCIDSKKLRKNYFRKWYFRIGVWKYFESQTQSAVKSKKIDISGSMFKGAVKNSLLFIWYTFSGIKTKAFYMETQLISFTGYLFQNLKTSLSVNKVDT